MSSPSADTRVTAYVFGELSQSERHQFEKELGESETLREEVAAVRDAVAAVRAELDGEAEGVGQERRSRIEAAIASSLPGSTVADSAEDVASPSTAVVASNSVQKAAPSRRLLSILALAASMLLIVALIYTNRPAEIELSMNDELRRDRPQPTRGLPDQPQSKAAGNQSKAAGNQSKAAGNRSAATDGLAMKGYPLESPQVAVESLEKTESLAELDVASSHPAGTSADRVVELQMRTDGVEEADAGELEQLSASNNLSDPFSESVVPLEESVVPVEEEERLYRGRDADASSTRARKLGRSEPGNQSKQRSLRSQLNTPAEPFRDGTSPLVRRAGRDDADKKGLSKSDFSLAAGLGGAAPVDSFGISPDGASPGGALPDGTSPGGTSPGGASPDGRGIAGGRAVRGETIDSGIVTELSTMGGIELGRGAAAEGTSGDRFEPIEDNPFVDVDAQPLSTFSIDVDTASYAKVRKYLLQQNVLPPAASVRIEELVNYFPYDYAPPANQHPFAAAMEIAECPWNPDHRLARIGIKGRVIEQQRPPSNLVFLLDVSGSMTAADKLPLVVEGMKLLTEQLTENDSVAIAVYAGNAGLVLDATNGDQKQTIISALERLRAGGSTDGGSGINLAYNIARDHFVVGGTNRVILCTDGDFNVGLTGTEELKQLAEDNAESNVYLSVLGFGIGNHNDAMMEEISNRGNGNYAFIDSKSEAQKVLVEQMGGTLVTIAKDVKIQVAFNADEVQAYRLIGYENRMLKAEDFDNDAIDAGEIGAGHTVTALYELVPPRADDEPAAATETDSRSRRGERDDRSESLTLKLNYKMPDTGAVVKGEIEIPVVDRGKEFAEADDDFQFAAAVASFGMLLRNSPHRGDSTFAAVDEIASGSVGDDSGGYRTEFLEMVRRAKQLRGD